MTDARTPLSARDPADLLPERRRDEARRVQRPIQVLEEVAIDASHGIAVVQDARGVAYGVPYVDTADGRRRARAGDGTAVALLQSLARDRLPEGLLATVFRLTSGSTETAIDVDQTNDLVVVDGRVVVKWLLHPVTGDQPGPRRLAALARSGFDGTPATWAIVELASADGPRLAATVSDYVSGAEDGWDWAVAEVRGLARGEETSIDHAVTQVADLVARMHVALASAGTLTASSEDAERWVTAARADADAADLMPDVRARVDLVLARLGESAGTITMPVHGDLHIGQILRAGDPARYLVIDFDGNPTQSPAERLAAQPAARDVAGMLASWDHVGRVVLHRTPGLDDVERGRVVDWIQRVQESFLAEYLRVLGGEGYSQLLDRALLLPMQVQQECREYAYAHRYLPHWRYVPDAALPELLERASRTPHPTAE